VIRHFTRISTWNYAIDLGMYPLGSCTMKYNPRVNEHVARLDGLASEHPAQPAEVSQGCLRILYDLQKCLLEITGMDAATLQPAAGAQGELTGLLMIRAYLQSQGNARKKVLIPDSAHGTNPASVVIAGYEVQNIKSNARGQIDTDHLREFATEDVAALMVTNPSTIGVFEERIAEIAAILHERGALLYMDGANMNALAGVTRPGDFGVDVMHLNLHKTFSTPHGGGGPGAGPVLAKKILEPFLPVPVVVEKNGRYALDGNRPQSVGRVRAYCGNFGVLLRALAYTARIRPRHPAGDRRRRAQRQLMIEPTESESREELDLLVDALQQIAKEAAENPELVKSAPHTTRRSRLDETAAARKPVLRWKAKPADTPLQPDSAAKEW
jgi:glycine dehydrogenase subunit 2